MVQATDDLTRVIDEHPFFADMPKPYRDLVVGCARNERFDAGEYIFREGQEANRFYLVRTGQVAVEVHVPGREPLVVETLGHGEVLGWSWLVKPYKWTFDARAMQLTRAISLDGACLRGKMDDDHALAYELLSRFVPVMSERISAARMQLMDMYGSPRERRQ